MNLQYHQKLFELLDTSPQYYENNAKVITDFQTKYDLKLPEALCELYLTKNWQHVLASIIPNQYIVELHRVTELNDYIYQNPEPKYIFFLIENQWVYFLAVQVNGKDPQVLKRYNKPNEPWENDVPTFSQWLFDIAWDHLIINERKGKMVNISNEAELQNHLEECEVIFSESYDYNMYYRGYNFRFIRALHQGTKELITYAPPS